MDDPAKIENITVFWGRNRGPLIYSNTFVVEQDAATIIVDPGGESPYLTNLAGQNNYIVNTHFHGDHRRLNYLFTKSEFFAPEPDAPMIESNEKFVDAVGITDTELRDQWLNVVKTIYHITEHHISGTFNDGDYVIDRKYGIRAIGLPGHTHGHCGLYFENASLALITDIDLTDFGPWYGNEVSDIDTFLESIDKVRSIDARHFITSHSGTIYTKEQVLPLLDKFAAHIKKREKALLKMLERNSTASLDELATEGIIYSRTTLANNPALMFFERKMLEKHMKKLGIKTGV